MFKFTRPTLVTLTAPTCSGKNYLRERLERDVNFTRLVSTTTRAPRTGEVDGSDYHFITPETSARMEAQGEFAELINFRGTRYGVTHREMNMKMGGDKIPCVILEPQGLTIYKKLCIDNGWDIFKIFIFAKEDVRIKRLGERTLEDICEAHDDLLPSENGEHLRKRWTRLVDTHTDRMLSILGDERHWQSYETWDAIVDGENADKAVESVKQGIKWRNSRTATPTPYTHEQL